MNLTNSIFNIDSSAFSFLKLKPVENNNLYKKKNQAANNTKNNSFPDEFASLKYFIVTSGSRSSKNQQTEAQFNLLPIDSVLVEYSGCSAAVLSSAPHNEHCSSRPPDTSYYGSPLSSSNTPLLSSSNNSSNRSSSSYIAALHRLPLNAACRHITDTPYDHNRKRNRKIDSSSLSSAYSPILTNTRWVEVEGYLIECGPEPIDISFAHHQYTITPTIRQYLSQLSRILSGSNVPILLEGPTSAGKTSLVKFLARLTGHRFIRVNNHQHTDVDEYLGQNQIDPKTGDFVFVEGVLAQAARNGYWILLDELNLAPSEVLEGKNFI